MRSTNIIMKQEGTDTGETFNIINVLVPGNPEPTTPFDIILQNIENHFKNDPPTGRNPSLKEFTIEITKRVWDDLIAHKLVGVQAVTPNETGKAKVWRLLAEMKKEIRIEKFDVYPKLHKLRARYNMELAYDSRPSMKEMEEEIYRIMSLEITTELDHDLIRTMHLLCKTHSETMKSSCEMVSDCMGFAWDIRRASAYIAKHSRRGRGNWCVVNNLDHKLLMMSKDFTPVVDDRNSAVVHVGNLLNEIRVYCDPYLDDETPIMVGFLGANNSHVDSGLIQAFHLPVVPNLAIDMNTFQPVIDFSSRNNISTIIKDDAFERNVHYDAFYRLIEVDHTPTLP